ncbi:MAG: hypothetical protein AAGG11_23835 [Pseudomonadota bacterium]
MTEATHPARLRHLALGAGPLAPLLLELELLDPQAFVFRPGQYSAIVLPDGKLLTLSIASGPSRLPTLRFLYRATPGDPQADALNALLRTGTRLELSAPGGQVCWDVAATTPSLLVCAGTGISQAYAILETVADQAPERLPTYEVLALAGSDEEQLRHPQDSFWQTAGLKLVRVSDPALGADNTGLVWLRDAAPRLQDSRARVLIGGGPAFVYTVHDLLTAAGLDAARFAADAYEYAPR